jgi:hypothetical protein
MTSYHNKIAKFPGLSRSSPSREPLLLRRILVLLWLRHHHGRWRRQLRRQRWWRQRRMQHGWWDATGRRRWELLLRRPVWILLRRWRLLRWKWGSTSGWRWRASAIHHTPTRRRRNKSWAHPRPGVGGTLLIIGNTGNVVHVFRPTLG